MCVYVHAHTPPPPHTHRGGGVVNGVFEWNRMTVGIHADFPLLKSAIRPTVYSSADVPAHRRDLRPLLHHRVCVCVCMHAGLRSLPVPHDL